MKRYYWLKSKGICVVCGSADARDGKTRCLDCSIADTAKRMKYYERRHESFAYKYKVAESRSRLTYERRKAGLCTRCGKEPSEGYSTCDSCRIKNRIRQATLRYKLKKA